MIELLALLGGIGFVLALYGGFYLWCWLQLRKRERRDRSAKAH